MFIVTTDLFSPIQNFSYKNNLQNIYVVNPVKTL